MIGVKSERRHLSLCTVTCVTIEKMSVTDVSVVKCQTSQVKTLISQTEKKHIYVM